MAARYIVGDVHDVLATLPDDSVDLVLTSPPFLALRSYLPDDHPDKSREIGREAAPADFIDALLDVVEACDRVLAPHGSLAFELGDTYSGSNGAGGDYNTGGMRDGQQRFNGSARSARSSRDGWPLAKSLTLIPESFRWALAYGHNPHNGRQTAPWRVRNVARWCRPNPPVGALGDKWRPATSEMVVACHSKDRWFDLDAVRGKAPSDPAKVYKFSAENSGALNPKMGWDGPGSGRVNPNGAPPLDWWQIPTQPYAGSHYATWPEKLCVTPILSMCPRHVCTTCGQPRRRIAETTSSENITVGWSDCGHNTWRTGVVLDPFAGSGTTLKVADGHGRDAIGIDLDERNAALAEERIGPMFLTIEGAASVVAR